MCGIAGLFSREGAVIDSRHLEKMTSLIRHRGPDDGGYVLFSKGASSAYSCEDTPEALDPLLPRDLVAEVGLGHRRLSIVDLSPRAHQPMRDRSGRFWISYNGEIYNHVELRKELEGLGCQFRSDSDTEVLLQSYLQWGECCLERLNGMFAFVIYDAEKRHLFAARDRFGIKPLYYWVSPAGILAIASEIKQFTVLDGWEAQLDGQAAYDFLLSGLTDHSERTCFAGVKQLRGGHLLSGTVSHLLSAPIPQRWYQLPVGRFSGSFEEASLRFRELLSSSIEYRLMADVPVGSCLSGGLDSSSIVCLVNEQLQRLGETALQRTFSAQSIHKLFDESEFMQVVIDQREVKAHFCTPQLDDVFRRLDEVIWHQDEPFGSTSIFAQWDVFQLARQNAVKVMLDGQGADEQLAGYSGYFHIRFNELARGGRFLELLRERRACKELHNIEAPLLRLLLNRVPGKQALSRLLGRAATRACHDWMDSSLLNVSIEDPQDLIAPIRNPLLATNYIQTTATNLPMLLRYEDRDSMAHSVEARVPFVDHRLVEFCQSLPSDYKLSRGITKRVLRKGMQGILPEKIRNRMCKLGFATPEELWVQKDAPDQFRDALREAVELSRGVLTPEAVRIGDAMIAGELAFNFQLWRMIIFGKWMQRFSVQL